MIYNIIEAFKESALRHKAVNTFKYLDELLINAQPNNENYQVIIETDPLMQFSGNPGLCTLNMTVLSHVDSTEQEIQDIASQIGLSIIYKTVEDNPNIMNLKDYSILFFTKKSDDCSAGCRFTISLGIPEFIDRCTMLDFYLNDEEYKKKLESMKDKELDLGEITYNGELDLKPICK